MDFDSTVKRFRLVELVDRAFATSGLKYPWLGKPQERFDRREIVLVGTI